MSELVMTERTAGVVSTVNWLMAPNGNTYHYFWCESWMITTDKQFPVDDLRTSERWQLLAMVGGQANMILPGCEVKAWCRCETPPPGPSVYVLGPTDRLSPVR